MLIFFFFFFHLLSLFLYGSIVSLGFLGGSAGKESPAMQETQVHSLGWEDPLEKGMATLLAGESHGQSNLAGYSPQGHKELDMTERHSTVHLQDYISIRCTTEGSGFLQVINVRQRETNSIYFHL